MIYFDNHFFIRRNVRLRVAIKTFIQMLESEAIELFYLLKTANTFLIIVKQLFFKLDKNIFNA